ncbi:MAG: hypothetical protein A4E25_02068 [Methanobacterium sp. PtaB.Bin024]|nr:MAG: hypothetical protein A4E25_02068 [Methanobacterium sp. PtaB.Bin024]
MTFKVFICYESKTGQSYAQNLYEALEKDGENAFLASSKLLTKHKWREKIDAALEEATYFVLIYTAVTSSSSEVKRECQKALKLKKDFITCRWHQITVEKTKELLNELSDLHQIKFEDKHDLANKAIVEIAKLRRAK